MRPDPAIQFWEGDEMALGGGVTLIRLGGHFPGSTVLHWTPGEPGEGLLMTGDTMQVVADPGRVSFMYSYPNLIPMSATTVRRMADRLQRWRVDRVYGFNVGRQIVNDGSAAIEYSAQRYIALLAEPR